MILLLSILLLCGCAHLPELGRDLKSMAQGSRVRELRPGVLWARWPVPGRDSIHILAIDIQREDLFLKPVLSHDSLRPGGERREGLDGMAQRTGALALISSGNPPVALNVSGLTVIDGKTLHAPQEPQAPSLVLERGGGVRIGFYRPGLEPLQAVSGEAMLLEDGTPVETAALRGVRTEWAAACARPEGGWMFWVLMERAERAEAAAVLRRLGCRDGLVLASGGFAGIVLRGGRAAESEVPDESVGAALGLFESAR